MTDNTDTDDESLEKSIPAQPENITSNKELKDMEIHHHPNLHHKPKPWKEYLLEFLMIFLAVSMGFFAESYREHLSDQSKEKEYVHSLIEDLKTDQRLLSKHIEDMQSGISMMDSMIGF